MRRRVENDGYVCYNNSRLKMKSLYMVNKVYKIIVFIAFFSTAWLAACAAFFLPVAAEPDFCAFASETPVVTESVKGSYFKVVDGTAPVVEEKDYVVGGYASNVTVTFSVSTDFYLLTYTVDGATVADRITETPVGGKVIFVADKTGRYVLTCAAYETETDENPTGSATAEFLNDSDAPAASGPAVGETGEWKRTGQDYVATVDWGVFADARSGIGALVYRFAYDDGTYSEVYEVNLLTAGKTELTVKRKCSMQVVCVDKAGNGFAQTYEFDRFDDYAPPMPVYEITPAQGEGVYAQKYEIKAEFLSDNGGSGLKDVQSYSINGETYRFEAKPPIPESIILDKPIDYTVRLYATDNAGNVSQTVEIKIPYSAFDVTLPDVKEVTRQIDLSDKNGFCRVTVNANDKNESGIASVVSEDGKIVFSKAAQGAADLYSARFDCYGFGKELCVILTDNVGNKTRYVVAFPYFYDADVSEAVRKCVEKLRKTDLTAYTAAAAKNVNDALNKANLLLSLDNSAKTEILNEVATITELIDKTVTASYEIESVPEYASANITLSLTESDFSAYPKGSVVNVVLSGREGDERDYVEIAGFKRGFTDFFSLTVKINGETPVAPLAEGVYVGMNKPSAYYDREVAIIDAATGEVVTTEVKNNRIFFTIKGDADYVLVVSGGKAVTSGTESVKTITVFGKEMKLSVFLGIVCGTCGGCLVIVAALLIFMKARR